MSKIGVLEEQDATVADLLKIPRDKWSKPKPKLTIGDVERLVAIQGPSCKLGVDLEPTIEDGFSWLINDLGLSYEEAIEAPNPFQFMGLGCPDTAAKAFERSLVPDSIMELAIRAIEQSEFRVQPWLRVSAALAAMSLTAGRKIQTRCGILPKLYQVNVAPTGEGKDIGGKLVRKIDDLTKNENPTKRGQVEDMPFSDSGLLAMLKADPVRLILVDELGQLMGANKKTANANNGRLFRALTNLFTHGRGGFSGPHYADAKKQKESGGGVESTPFVSLLMLSQRETLSSELSAHDLESGLLPRCLLFMGHETPEARQGSLINVPELLLKQVRAWRSWGPDDPLDGAFGDHFEIFDFTDDALDLIGQFDAYWLKKKREGYSEGDKSSLVFARGIELVKKVALLIAANNLLGPPQGTELINAEDVRYAIGLVGQCLMDLKRLATDHISDTDTERRAKEMLAFIRKPSPNGKPGRTLSEITRKFQKFTARDRVATLQDLRNSQLIREQVNTGSGKPTTFYIPF